MNPPSQAQRIDTLLQHGMLRPLTNDRQLQARLPCNGLGECLYQHFEAFALYQPPDRAQRHPFGLRQLQRLPGLVPAQQRFDERQRVERHA
ncbi:hypothetical protein D3C81_1477380 [compost metagenome]